MKVSCRKTTDSATGAIKLNPHLAIPHARESQCPHQITEAKCFHPRSRQALKTNPDSAQPQKSE
ncbi:rCG60650 [Rattus norvegicus]|uniref:RCG60650 n=1 Tax=Rattus norvegicus TaxID=10116 RepID=A6JKT0_RAT|nr:rCG60650 [Rattus norvegicus]